MHPPVTLLRLIGKAVLDTAGEALVGDFIVDLLPEVAHEVWSRWNREQTEPQRRAEVEALIHTPAEDITRFVADIVAELTVDQPPALCHALDSYLNQVPVTIRHSFRRLTDPAGNNVPSGLPLDVRQLVQPDFLQPAEIAGQRARFSFDSLLAEVLQQVVVRVDPVERRVRRMRLVQVPEEVVDEMGQRLGSNHLF